MCFSEKGGEKTRTWTEIDTETQLCLKKMCLTTFKADRNNILHIAVIHIMLMLVVSWRVMAHSGVLSEER